MLAGWKLDDVAEGYVKTLVENKKIIATKIMGSSVTMCSTCNVTAEKSSFNMETASVVNFTNGSNCVIYVNEWFCNFRF